MLELGICEATQYDVDGFIGIQIDGLGGQDAGTPYEQLSHQYGFLSRPLDPANDTGCSLFRWSQGRTRHAWLGDDPRISALLPQVKKGGSVQYASDGSFASFDPETHTWTVYVPYSSSPAKAHLVTVGKDGNGTPIVEMASGEGPSFTILDRVTTLKNASGSAYLFIDDDGTNVVGPLKAAGGADLGGPTSLPLTKHPDLLALLGALSAYVATMTPTPATAAAASAFATALGAFTTAGGTLTTKGA